MCLTGTLKRLTPRRPVVCFDETSVQLIGETRLPWPAEPGKPTRIDYEYRRNGTANLFVFLDAHQPWRHVKGTERKTAHDFAHCMHELVEAHYRDAETVRGVLDNCAEVLAAPGGHGVKPRKTHVEGGIDNLHVRAQTLGTRTPPDRAVRTTWIRRDHL